MRHNVHIISKIKNFIVRISVKRKLMFILIIQAILFSSVTLFLPINSITSAVNQYKTENGRSMAAFMQKINTSLDQMKEISLFPIQPLSTGQYQEVYSYLEDNASFIGNFSFANAFFEKAKSYLDITQGFDLIAMYDSTNTGLYCWSGNTVYSGTYCTLSEDHAAWYADTVKNRGAATLIPVSHFTGSGIPSADQNTLCIARSITHIGKYQSMGILMLGISQATLNGEFELMRASEREDFILLHDGLVIAGDRNLSDKMQQDITEKILKSGKNIDYITINSEHCMISRYQYNDHLSIITITPLTDIFSGMSIRNFSLIGVLFLLLLSMLLFTIYATSSINKSIDLLVTACNRLENRDFDVTAFSSQKISGEFQILFTAFSQMSSKIDYLINEVFQKDLEKRNIELYALRSQINSHYLNNTLELIRMKAYMQKSYDLAEMAMLLGSNLQYNLKEIDDEVTIREEIESVQNYIKLIQYNYSDGICFSINVDEKILEQKIMKLILQPVIENTIAHAYGKTPQFLHIDIMGYSLGEDIVLTVADDGNGMTAERLLEVQNALLGKQSSCQRIGLKNINKRIKLFYGDDYGIEINSAKNIGTTTSIRIPGKKRKGEQ